MSQVTVFDPFREVRSLIRGISDDPFFQPASGHRQRFARRSRNGELAPPIDAYKIDGALKVETPLPGFSADEIAVRLEKGVLTVRAEPAPPTAPDTDGEPPDGTGTGTGTGDRAYVVQERHSGAASRSVLIGDDYDAESVEATLKNGVLTLTIQRVPEAQPKQIEVKAG